MFQNCDSEVVWVESSDSKCCGASIEFKNVMIAFLIILIVLATIWICVYTYRMIGPVKIFSLYKIKEGCTQVTSTLSATASLNNASAWVKASMLGLCTDAPHYLFYYNQSRECIVYTGIFPRTFSIDLSVSGVTTLNSGARAEIAMMLQRGGGGSGIVDNMCVISKSRVIVSNPFTLYVPSHTSSTTFTIILHRGDELYFGARLARGNVSGTESTVSIETLNVMIS